MHNDTMVFTGERFVPEADCDLLGTTEHVERYSFAGKYAQGKVVLDIACGTGYGSHMLLQAGATTVTAVDISDEAIQFAAKRYQNERIRFIIGDAENYQHGHFDLIVSFETLEHLDNRQLFLNNLSSMLNDDGMLIISTPNKAITSPLRRPGNIRNKYHKYEYLEQEFILTLQNAGFNNIQKYGQHPYPAIFNNQIVSRLFRRWIKPRVETAHVTAISNRRLPRYFVYIARK